MVADMDRRTTRRLASVASGAMAVFAFLAVPMAPAFAQVPEPGDLIEETTDKIDDATTGIGNGIADAVDEATGDSSAGDIVRETTGTAGDVVGDTGAAVDDALDDAIGGSLQPVPDPGEPNVGNRKNKGRFSTGSSTEPQLLKTGSSSFDPGLAPVGTAPAAGFVEDNTISGTRRQRRLNGPGSAWRDHVPAGIDRDRRRLPCDPRTARQHRSKAFDRDTRP